MKKFLQRVLSLTLALALVTPFAVTARASDALGEDLTQQDTLLNEQTCLSTNVFWSTTYSDRRTENLITYTPNSHVTPIVTYGNVLTSRSTVSSVARTLESRGQRVVAGINGDFYDTGSGLPIGITVSQGQLISSDGGFYAIGFRSDGSTIMGKPQLKVEVDLGYDVPDAYGTPVRAVQPVAGVNKSRVSTGGIYLYTYDFNSRHTNGATEPGVDVVCTMESGTLAIGESLSLRVEQVLDGSTSVPVQPNQVVLSANLKSDPGYLDALRGLTVGSQVTVHVSTPDPVWGEVDYAIGALYSLVENGAVVPGLPSGAHPRTAAGLRPDGTVLFYTIDGRRSGHSIGATMVQVAKRLIELGCTTALCLDGGGSTTLSVTQPNATSAAVVNRTSGSERAVTNHIFLVADSQPSGELSHFYVRPAHTQVLAGSSVEIAASAVDTNYIPMQQDFTLTADGGELSGTTLKTPRDGGTITVTASGGGREGTASVQAVAQPDQMSIRRGDQDITSLTAAPGSVTELTVSAAYRHLPLYADASAVVWTVTGDIGTVDAQGRFTAEKPGTGTITANANGKTASVNVTVNRLALATVEDFEGDFAAANGYGSGITVSATATGEPVRFGRKAMKLDYQLSAGTAEWSLLDPLHVSGPYTGLNLWLCGDNSGNTLEVLAITDTGATESVLSVPLNFTGWKPFTLRWNENMALQGFRVSGTPDGTGKTSGTLYLDQIVATFDGTVDTQVPAVSITGVKDGVLTASVSDAVDGVLPRDAVSVTLDGKAHPFSYTEKSGVLSVSFTADGAPHRLTVTARDGSGNLGRASHDIPAGPDAAPIFTDTAGYWGKSYVDYMYTSGITTGYADHTFRPNSNISRAQFSVMLFRYLGLDESRYEGVTLPFADLAAIPDYALPAIRALYTEGIINGTTGSDGQLYFNPGSSLTRAQAASMIGRTQPKGYAMGELTFTDRGSIPAYAAEYIATMTAQQVISGYADGSFKPHNSITRGQMAKILYNLM